MKDTLSYQRIQQCHPKVRSIFQQFIEKCESEFAITLRVMMPVFRSIEEQDKLYAQGRTTPGKVVTNAKGGSSFHNYGLAIDICELTENGEVNWNFDNGKLAPIGKSFNLEWGGDWHSCKDKPHFQYTFGKTWQELLATSKDKDGYSIIDQSSTPFSLQYSSTSIQ